MNNIILSITKIITEGFAENLKTLVEEKQDVSEFILNTKKDLDEVGCKLIAEGLETLDEAMRETPKRKKEWYIHQREMPNTLATIFGQVHYKRTYYKSKENGRCMCISDAAVGIEAHDKMDLSLKAKCVEGAVDVSYQKSGKNACEALELTGQTVMNAIKWLGPVQLPVAKETEEKREVQYLFIEADEDHVAMREGKRGEPKLVYLHEGVEMEGGRWKLKNPVYFSGMFHDTEALWVAVEDYIDMTYEREKVQRIYLSGDRGKWIRSGANWIKDVTYVVDKYHLMKYITKAGCHVENGCREIWKAIRLQDREYLETVLETIQDHPDSDGRDLENAFQYIRASFATTKHYFDKAYPGCSAESHVSHILSDRLSSRPRVWGEDGIDRMARLRVEVKNGGKIYPLMLKMKQERRRAEKEVKINEAIIQKRKLVAGDELIHNLPYINRGKICDSLRMMRSFRGL